jgi:hypothetical protein
VGGKLQQAVAALEISAAILSEAVPRYSDEITRPSKREGKPIALTAGSLNVEWDLKKKQFWTEKRLLDHGGAVTIYGPDDRRLVTVECPHTECEVGLKDGSTGQPLAPGAYQVRIESREFSVASGAADFVIAAPPRP